ncbi:HCL086Cp [Eremothecium sinecaudum]|uniref:Autophagy-related protein 20 n=1 Tax=Eremothecium sinecaudum TaxID=45286 RepID=A0A0X8HRF3_9SACH|nr:HCL086Cp [Eremothecium sinecaudum]AMD20065.1 HCL086Cp [Eremothecium sinecaudum]
MMCDSPSSNQTTEHGSNKDTTVEEVMEDNKFNLNFIFDDGQLRNSGEYAGDVEHDVNDCNKDILDDIVTDNCLDMLQNGSNKGSSNLNNVSEISESDTVHMPIVQEDNPFVEHRLERELSQLKASTENRFMESKSDSIDKESYEGISQPPSKSQNSRDEGNDFISNSNESSVSIRERLFPLSVEKSLHASEKIKILEASKVSEGQGRSHITYTVKFGDKIVRRRYSEFESLRKLLIKLFPMSLIPPIPEKQSLTSYGKAITGSDLNYILPPETDGRVDLGTSVIDGSVGNTDQKLVRHRIRMLTSFLNRLLNNSEISKTSIISDFLDPNNTNWNDVMTSSAAISSLPKNVLRCNPLDPTNTTRVHAFLPIPSSPSTQILKGKDEVSTSVDFHPDDLAFFHIEHDYRKYEHILQTGIYKYSRRITKSFNELKQDFRELSDAFAEFAVDETQSSEIKELLSRLSASNTATVTALESLVSRLYYNINEPLCEVVLMIGAARELIQYRKMKFIQRDILKRTLLYKNGQLRKFQEQEEDAKRTNQMASRELSGDRRINLQRIPEPNTQTYKGKIFNNINKLAHIVKETVNYQDQDNKATIPSVQRDIEQIGESLDISESDLKVITETIRDEQLPKFSREKDEEIFDILKNYSKYMREFAEQNLIAWKELKNMEQSA